MLECLNKTEIESLYKIPKTDDPECYDKLILQLKDFFVRDNREELDLLLNDLTLGDKTPNELMTHLIAVSGIENDPSPQFETVLKDKFLRALPSDIASSSGIWSYQNLRELAQCATNAMNAAHRYRKNSCPVLANSNGENNARKNVVKQPTRYNNCFPFQNRMPRSNIKNKNPLRFYICYYHRRFKQSAIKCKGPICRFYSLRF